MDEIQRRRIRDDLRGLLKGELRFDPLTRALYSTDASVFQVEPIGVATPRDEEDVQALVTYARENHVPLIPRGAGTGLAGESLGAGLVVDLSRHFRSILSIGPDSVRVQPGVLFEKLNARLAQIGRRFAPDPTSGVQCTIGGMLATNASGAHALKYGYTRDHVRELRVVLDSGEASSVGSFSRGPLPDGTSARLAELIRQVSELLDRNGDLIRECRPRTPFNRCGYLLHDVLSATEIDLARLLVGSEGTLGIFTEATLRTIPLPESRGLVLVGFTSLEAAVEGALRILDTQPTACELIDRRLVSLARGRGPDLKSVVPAGAEAVLIVEYESEADTFAHERAAALGERLQRSGTPAVSVTMAFEKAEIDRLWQLRETVLPSLYGLRGGPQPVAFIEDVGVPVEELANYLHRLQEILQRHETTASFLVHAGTGQVHARPFLDLQNAEDVSRLWALGEEIHSLALELGGTVSSQHGTGLARTPWVSRQYGRLYPVFRELKSLFDPGNIFNPGKIVGPSPGMPAWPLRHGAIDACEPPAWSINWQSGEIRTESGSCNGCGHCRTESATQRMCPLFRVTHAEAATPRAKANLLRFLLRESADVKQLSTDEVREIADLCIQCRMCATECPAHVNIPKLMLELKAANTSAHGMDRIDWSLARAESFAALASHFPMLVNAALRSRTMRWFMERLFGISRRRRLPTLASRSFLRRARARGWTTPPSRRRLTAAYFVDVYPNHIDPQIAEAVVAVLQHNDVEVYVPPNQRACGMAPYAYGDVESAREAAQHNIRVLAEVAREGMPIVCSEPTAAVMLQQDYPDLVDDPDAALVAEHVVEFTTFLWDLHEQGRLRTDFNPLELAVGHHVPCHLKALGRPAMGPALLELIPGMGVHTIDVSCSGMAGTFGLSARDYENSMAAGRPMLDELDRPRNFFGSTECSTCRLQMEEGTGKRTLHPAQYLALSYGLLPDVAQRLQAPLRELVLQ